MSGVDYCTSIAKMKCTLA